MSNFHSIQAEIALRSVGNGQKAGASPASGSLYRSEGKWRAIWLITRKQRVRFPPLQFFYFGHLLPSAGHAPWSNSTTPLS